MAVKERGTRTKTQTKVLTKLAAPKTNPKPTVQKPVAQTTPVFQPRHRSRVMSRRVRFMTLLMAVPLMGLWLNYASHGWQLTEPPSIKQAVLRGSIKMRNGTVLAQSVNVKDGWAEREERRYPQDSSAGSLIGFKGADRGLEGLEYFFENNLKNGNDITLTLDPVFQAAAEAALERTILKNEAEAGSVVALESGTGRVLAVANYPRFNPNKWDFYPSKQRINRAFRNLFEPGSTVKALVAAALLNENLVSTETSIAVPMHREVTGHNIDDPLKHGPELNLSDILTYSSNVGISTLAERMQESKLYEYLTKFGFGNSLDMDSVSDQAGHLPAWQRWYPIDRASMSFGQGLSTTTLGLAAAFSVLANDGLWLAPHLIEGEAGVRPRRVISVQAARSMRQILQGAVEHGSVREAAVIPGYCVGGKTGTAQVSLNGKAYEKDVYSGLFAGFFPVDHPRVTMVVEVYNGKRFHHGADVSAPAFRDIAEEILAHWGVAPDPNKCSN